MKIRNRAENVTVRNNIVYPDMDLSCVDGYTPGTFGIDNESGNKIGEDPFFNNKLSHDFRLTENSNAAINTGVNVTGLAIDYAGNLRDSQPDIGAYEYGATGLPRDGGQPDPDNNPTPPNPNPNNSGILSPDLNCDNKVNVIDFGILLSWWGPYNGGYSHPNCSQ